MGTSPWVPLQHLQSVTRKSNLSMSLYLTAGHEFPHNCVFRITQGQIETATFYFYFLSSSPLIIFLVQMNETHKENEIPLIQISFQ